MPRLLAEEGHCGWDNRLSKTIDFGKYGACSMRKARANNISGVVVTEIACCTVAGKSGRMDVLQSVMFIRQVLYEGERLD